MNLKVGNDVISVVRFSNETYRADHPSDNKHLGSLSLSLRRFVN